MPYIHDLAYYGGNANNQRYLESLAAAKVTPAAPAPSANQISAHAKELAAAQALVAQLQADDSPALTGAQLAVVTAAELAATLVPVPPANPPVWKAKA